MCPSDSSGKERAPNLLVQQRRLGTGGSTGFVRYQQRPSVLGHPSGNSLSQPHSSGLYNLRCNSHCVALMVRTCSSSSSNISEAHEA